MLARRPSEDDGWLMNSKRPPGNEKSPARGNRKKSSAGSHAGKSHPRRNSRPGKDRPQVNQPDQALRGAILEALAGSAMNAQELAQALNIPVSNHDRLEQALKHLELQGEIARVRKHRYIIPELADLFTGVIQFHANGSSHVLSETPDGKDLLVRAENTSTAMHGDRVVARIVTPGLGGFRGDSTGAKKEGRVIRILTRANSTIVGTLQQSKKFHYVVPDDPRIVKDLYVPPPDASLKATPGDKVVAKLDAWESRHLNPEGHVIEVLGPANAPGVDMLSIIRKHNLPQEFPAEVQRLAATIGTEVDPRDTADRLDLRDHFVFTIDPDDAKDFDDAIQIERTPAGWKVAIHIADVSHYVKPRNPLDKEASTRGNSIYLVDRVIPMLPEALSNGICSLKPHVDRLAFSVLAEIDKSGKPRSVRFAKTVIRSAHRLTYKQALAILEKPPGKDPLANHVHTAWELSSLLRKKRFAAGSLDLDFPEIKVRLDNLGRPVALERLENDISHQLIEELMLLANELVARELKLRKQPTVYRIHEKPDPEKLMEFREFAASQGLRAGDLTQRGEIQRLLAQLPGKPFSAAVKIALLKSLKRARYFTEPLGHYGLSKADYTHFTSPIRRYSDLLVHRALERRLGLSKSGPDSASLANVSEHLSTTERTAADAERESVRLKKLEFFQLQAGAKKRQKFDAVIMDARNFGLFVELPEFLLTGLVHISALPDDFFVFDAPRCRLIGRRTKKTYKVGDKITVAVDKVDMFKQQVDFKPA